MHQPITFRQLVDRYFLTTQGATDPDTFLYSQSVGDHQISVTLQITNRDERGITLFCNAFCYDIADDEYCRLPHRPDLPDWIPLHEPFRAKMLNKVNSWGDLQNTPWAFRELRFDIRPEMPGRNLGAHLSHLITPAIAKGEITLSWRVARKRVAEILKAFNALDDDPVEQIPDWTANWVIDIDDQWNAMICQSEHAKGRAYPLLLAFVHWDEWLPDGIKIKWVETTEIRVGAQYFEPECPDTLYAVIAVGNHPDLSRSNHVNDRMVVYCQEGADLDRVNIVSVQEFTDRFLSVA